MFSDRFLGQPQQPRRVSQQNPLARDCIATINGGPGYTTGFLFGKLPLGRAPVVSPFGIGNENASTVSTPTFTTAQLNPPCSFFAVVYCKAVSAGGSVILFQSENLGGDEIGFSSNPYAFIGNYYRNYVGAQITQTGSICPPVAGHTYLLHWSSYSATSHEFTVVNLNTRKTEIATSATDVSAISYQDFGVLRLGNATYGSVLTTGHFKSSRTQAEVKLLADNPWQIFEDIEDLIWVPSAAGGATYTLTAESGSFTETGQDAALTFNRVLSADSGSFAETGQDAILTFNRVLAAESGSFAETGQDAALTFNRVLSADSGSFALTGQDATLTYTPVSGATYTLVAASGTFDLAGADTALKFNRVLACDSGSIVLSGADVALTYRQAGFNRLKYWNGSSWAS